MKTSGKLRIAILAAAAGVLWGPAHGQEAGTKPDSAVSVGVIATPDDERDRTLFGQYNGLRKDKAHLLLDLDYVKRDDATGTWTTLRGRDLGLESRDIGFGLQRQGDWRFSADYSELVRRDPRTANTSMQGAGTTTPTISLLPAPGTGGDLEFMTTRKALGLAGDKWINRNWQFEVAFRNEDKDGSRRWGRGFTCPSGAAPAPAVCPTLGAGVNQYALLMLAEPIDWNTKQIDARVNYNNERLFVSAGYYGSFFSNANGSLNPALAGTGFVNFTGPNGAPTPVTLSSQLINILQLPMALPPDNAAHQFYLSGNYAFTQKVRSTFKLAYTHATQTQDFVGAGLSGAPGGRPNLGGELNTTLAQFGVTARPMSKLGLSANMRYEDKKDETPIDFYNIEGTNIFTNGHVSNRKIGAKAEATYQLTASTRAAAGVDYETIDRGGWVPTSAVAGLTALRQKNWETGYHGELRRSVSETLTGAVGFFHSVRDGSSWLRPLATTGVVENADAQIFNRTGIFPYSMTDRVRDKVRASADWTPTERISTTVVAEGARDHYGAPSEKGRLRGGMQLYSLDVAYVLTENWKVSSYASFSDQSFVVGSSTAYIADVHERNVALGLGVVGKPTGVLEVGARATYLRDVTRYGLGADPLSTATNVAQDAVGLPDITYREARLNVYGQYALRKNSDIRVDLLHVVTRLDEWTWGYNGIPFIYSDNTTVVLNPDQRATFVSARYIYRF